MKKYLLDTHVLVNWFGRRLESFSKDQLRVLRAASADHPLLLSEISLWEVANLVSLGRVDLSLPLRDWLETAVAPPLVDCKRISPAVAAEVASLPPALHRDPADRIIMATARVFDAAIITSDQRIIQSKVVPCID